MRKIKNAELNVNCENISEIINYLGFNNKQYSGSIHHDTQEFCWLLYVFSKDLNSTLDIDRYLNENKYSNMNKK